MFIMVLLPEREEGAKTEYLDQNRRTPENVNFVTFTVLTFSLLSF